MLARPNFAPVPKEHAANYGVGKRYDGHVVGSGPYKLAIYVPDETVVLDRNPHWDPATDPLRKAWVDRIQIKLNIRVSSIQRAIDRGTADLSLTSHVSAAQVPALRADPERSGRLSVEPSGCQVFLVLGTHPGAGAIADVRVRRAVNYAIDKDAYRDALARRYGGHGELASTILAPTSLGYQPYDLYPTPGGRGDPAKAKALLAEAGYPDGLTLSVRDRRRRQARGRQQGDQGLPGPGRDRPEGQGLRRHRPLGEVAPGYRPSAWSTSSGSTAGARTTSETTPGRRSWPSTTAASPLAPAATSANTRTRPSTG